jgi:hypothetical protein
LALIPGTVREAAFRGPGVMGISGQIFLGIFAVIAASAIMIMRNPARIFGRALSLNEAFCVCWVAYAIFMGVVMFYLGLKLPLALPAATNAPAIAIAICISIEGIRYLGRIQADWNGMVARSLFGLFTLVGLVAAFCLVWVNS